MMIIIFVLMLGGFAGILLLEIISKTFDFYSILKGDWDLALKPKAVTKLPSLLPCHSKGKNSSDSLQDCFPHPAKRFRGNAYQVLGFEESQPHPTLSALKEAYRKMISIYHPDLYANFPNDVQLEATRRAQIINASYHKLRNKY